MVEEIQKSQLVNESGRKIEKRTMVEEVQKSQEVVLTVHVPYNVLHAVVPGVSHVAERNKRNMLETKPEATNRKKEKEI